MVREALVGNRARQHKGTGTARLGRANVWIKCSLHVYKFPIFLFYISGRNISSSLINCLTRSLEVMLLEYFLVSSQTPFVYLSRGYRQRPPNLGKAKQLRLKLPLNVRKG